MKLDENQTIIKILVSGKLSPNVYVINACFAEIMSSNGSLSSGT